MFQPLISVIIPTHNRPDFLVRALTSVVEQTYTNWEVIIIDDGSPVGVYDDLQIKFSSDQFIWNRQPQSGPGVARKNGIKLASGDFFCFLDDDDYYLPDHFYPLVRAAESPSHQIYRSGLLGVSAEGEVTQTPGYENGLPTLPQYWKSPSNLTALLIGRAVIEKVPIDTVRTTIEDFTWLTRVFSHFDLFQLDNYSAAYVIHDANRNNDSYGKQYLWDRLNAMEAAYEYGEVASILSPSLKRNWISHQYFHFTRNSIRLGKWRQAIWAIVNRPKHFSLLTLKEWIYTLHLLVKTIVSKLTW